MSEPGWPEPAYVVRTARLTIRCYERADVRAVHRAVLDNIDALSPWMPWVENESGIATEATAALTRVGFERMGAKRTELHIDPANARSLAVPTKLGYRREGKVRGKICIAGELKPIIIFGMHADELASTPCASVAIVREGFLPDA